MGTLSRWVVVALATVALAGGAHAQQATSGTTDKQFAATFAALAFGLTTTQTKTAITVVRNAPSGLAIVDILLSTNSTGGFGFATTNTNGLLIANLIVTENQNQTQVSPN